MLKQRVITALLLLALFTGTLSVSAAWPFSALTLLLIGAAGWEWSRLCGVTGVVQWVQGLASVTVAIVLAEIMGLDGVAQLAGGVTDHAVSLALAHHVHQAGRALAGFVVSAWVWWLALLIWVVGGAWALRFGSTSWKRIPAFVRMGLGVVVLAVAWLALAEGRGQGVNFLLSMLVLVWAADIGAYFGGRALGRRKLAPSISPGKSWEGVWAGFVAVVLVASLWIWFDRSVSVDSPSLYSHLLQGLGPVGMALALMFLTAMSVVGDLFESLIKRQAGVKDSSQLLPGHGGVLDRIDALLPVLPIQMALLSLCHA
ncbi:MAG: phosphatidate cytidylyltransferase [Burkholderiales bacterium]|nr:phosphatidate cytidylyltransferase [Burkholderiales bacterium]